MRDIALCARNAPIRHTLDITVLDIRFHQQGLWNQARNMNYHRMK